VKAPRAERGPGAQALWLCGDRRTLVGAAGAATQVRVFAADGGPSLLALYVGRNSELLGIERLGRTEAVIEAPSIVGQARRLGATGFILAHYDPPRSSGPTAGELRASKELRRLGEDVDVYLLHHLIVGDHGLREIAG